MTMLLYLLQYVTNLYLTLHLNFLYLHLNVLAPRFGIFFPIDLVWIEILVNVKIECDAVFSFETNCGDDMAKIS